MTDDTRRGILRPALFIAGVGIVALIAGGGGYLMGAHHGGGHDAMQAEQGRSVLYWYDPMVPAQKFDKPGKSPFMDMQLVPRYADEAPDAAGVRIDPAVAQNVGVRLATVERAPMTRSVRAAGIITFNGRDVAVVQARTGGFIERTHRRAIGDVVAEGAPIVDIRVPEWAAAQAEYLALRQSGGDIAKAARHRLVMLGMSPALVDRIDRDGAPRPVVTITAPVAGAITALDAREGMTVSPGSMLASISGLSPVWLIASVPQADAGITRSSGRVTATLSAFPGETFGGRIESVLPAADPATRTVEVRIALQNPGGRLRPGMTAEVALIDTNAREVLFVPSEAVIRTGRRNVVITVVDDGRYKPVAVELGVESGARIEIRNGLTAGEKIVASGQFLIDSEASLSGALERLEASSATPGASQAHEATGRISAITSEGMMIAHGPVASLSWPAMTMQFTPSPTATSNGLAVGDWVVFHFHQDDHGYALDDIRKTERPR